MTPCGVPSILEALRLLRILRTAWPRGTLLDRGKTISIRSFPSSAQSAQFGFWAACKAKACGKQVSIRELVGSQRFAAQQVLPKSVRFPFPFQKQARGCSPSRLVFSSPATKRVSHFFVWLVFEPKKAPSIFFGATLRNPHKPQSHSEKPR